MNLTKHQTFEIFTKENRVKSFKTRYEFTTKTKAECITCGNSIFITYRKTTRGSIFCPECIFEYSKRPTLAQSMYIAKIKGEQLKNIESIIDLDDVKIPKYYKEYLTGDSEETKKRKTEYRIKNKNKSKYFE
jgi:hypothetical protein